MNRQAVAGKTTSGWYCAQLLVYQKDGCAPYVNTLYTSIAKNVEVWFKKRAIDYERVMKCGHL